MKINSNLNKNCSTSYKSFFSFGINNISFFYIKILILLIFFVYSNLFLRNIIIVNQHLIKIENHSNF